MRKLIHVVLALGLWFVAARSGMFARGPFLCPAEDSASVCDGVGTDGDGNLVLDIGGGRSRVLWIANDPEATVSKIDTRTGREIARYATVTHESVVNHAGRDVCPMEPVAGGAPALAYGCRFQRRCVDRQPCSEHATDHNENLQRRRRLRRSQWQSDHRHLPRH